VTGPSYFSLTSALTPEQQLALEDQRLVAELQAAEESAYERLIERFQGPVYNLACRLLNDPVEASDVVQDVFLKIFRYINAFRGESSLRTWVYRIALHEAYNRRRWRLRHRKGETALEDSFPDADMHERPLVDAGESPFDFTVNREAQLLLEEGLEQVSPVYRAALVLREVEDMSYDEIAEILEVSVGTVKSRIMRGREALRRYLASRLEPAPALQLVPRIAK
jgi:RNA polymerase sigma-70 factor (ECF subfamily)